MALTLKIKEQTINLETLDWQQGSLGNPFRQYRLRINEQMPVKYFDINGKEVNQFTKNRIEKYHWIYSFTYEDGNDFEIEVDYNNNFVKLYK